MTHPQLAEFIDMDLLSRLPSLELRARFIVDGFLTGLHRSPLKGSSAEFMGYRDYQPQDDLKQIDWKVYARTDRLHVRLREDETNMRVFLLVDQSASMDYRSDKRYLTKWDYARSLAAALLLFLSRQRDAAALGFAGDGLEEFMRGEGARQAHLHSMTARLYREAKSGKSRLADALDEMADHLSRRSVAIVISDFYEDVERLQTVLRRYQHEKCEVILFQVLDPQEISFEFKRSGILVEAETGRELPVNPELVREKYVQAVARHTAALRDAARAGMGDFLQLSTMTPPLEALGFYLAKRRGY